MTHDFDQQLRDTEQAWHDIRSRHEALPTAITLDLQFVPGDSPQWEECKNALETAGYQVCFYDDGSTLEASIRQVPNMVEEIWRHERTTTEIALQFGFKPDGWGFLSNPT